MLGAGLKAEPPFDSNALFPNGASGIAAAMATGITACRTFGDFSPV
jgi:hypothetical protein